VVFLKQISLENQGQNEEKSGYDHFFVNKINSRYVFFRNDRNFIVIF